ncbi:MAG: efflux RND transporter periplasmic adaptor subunit [Thiobacillus sp.]|nr:efflux RND transporter periplasmic adaptor subunit [Thiobacillus sp.]
MRLANLAPPGSPIEGQRLILRAPLGGVVVERQANPGTEVRPDAATPLFILSDLRHLWLDIDLPEQAAALARPGAAVNFTVEAFPDENFSARIEQAGAMVDPATRRIPVRALVDNADGRLKPEMFARATLSQPRAATVIRLPVGPGRRVRLSDARLRHQARRPGRGAGRAAACVRTGAGRIRCSAALRFSSFVSGSSSW